MKTKAFKKTLSVCLSLLMVLSVFGVLGAVSFAAVDESTLIGRYFSTDNVWYDAAKGANGIQWQIGDYPAYNANLGMTYFNGMYVLIDNANLFADVTRDTGVTFAFNYRPNFTGDHRHILSIGQNQYGDGTANHFFISGTTSWNSDGCFPMVEWVNGSGTETIKAYPQGVNPVLGKEYNIVVTVDKDAGIVFYVDGVRKTTVYKDSNLNDQIGNVRSFLDEVRNYHKNYIGCSRWTGDAKIEGYLSDVRIYRDALTDVGAYTLVADMAGTAFNLTKPSFNATAYHYSDPATGAYANLAYSSPATTEDSGMGIRGADNSSDYKDIEAVYFKFFTPLNVVMVYDGEHETYSSIELETKRHNKANVQDQRIYYVVSNSSLLKTRHNWYGYLDSAWTTWAGNYTASQINTDTSLDSYVGSTNDTPRFWWNAIKYTGTGNTDTYYDHEQNVSFTLQAFFDYTVGGTSKGTGTITTLSNYYVLNYKPVYDVLDAAQNLYNNEMSGKAWMYTEDSYAKAMLAMRRLALCNPNLYDYNGRGVDAASVMCAAAIKQAKTDYDAINLVKKQGNVVFKTWEGDVVTTIYNVNYGDAVPAGSVPAVPERAYTETHHYTDGHWDGDYSSISQPETVVTAAYTETAHEMVTDEAVPATCSNTGLTEGSHCSACAYRIEQTQVPINQNGHKWSWVSIDDEKHQQVCDYNSTHKLDAEDHEYNLTASTPADCENPGSETWTCSVCGHVKTVTLPALEHDYRFDSFVWSADFTSAQAKLICTKDPTHVIYEAATVTPDAHDATCTEDAYTVYTAVYGEHSEDKTVTDEGSAHHTLTFVPAEAGADCQTFGTVDHYHCAVCGKNFSDAAAAVELESISDNTFGAHNLTHHDAVPAARCTETGTVEYWSCSVCGKTFSDAAGTTEITVLDDETNGDHAYGEWIEEVSAKCGIPGVKGHYHCSVCGKDFDENKNVLDDLDIPALTHDLTLVPAVAGVDCQHTGTVAYYHCSLCLKKFTDETAAVEITDLDDGVYGAHTYGEWIAQVDAECGIPGVKGHYTCAVCGKDFDSDKNEFSDLVIPALTHDLTLVPAVAGVDCQHTGTVAYYHCSLCLKKFTDETAAVEITDLDDGVYGAHTYGEWIEEVSAKCGIPGVKGHYTCSVCRKHFDADKNELSDLVVPALTHNLTFVPAVAGVDCQHTGTVAYYHCSLCLKNFKDETAAVEITDLDDGVYGAHTYGEWIEEVSAKCGIPGVKGHYTCAVCGKNFDADKNELSDLVIPALTHDWNAPTYVWADDYATVTATRTCKNGDHPETETVGTVYSVVTPAKCGVAGQGKYVPKAFQNPAFAAQEKLVEIPALSHNLTFVPAKAGANCQQTGTVAYYHCSLCLKNFTDETATEELTDLSDNTYGEHTYGDWEKVDDDKHQRVCKHDASHVETEAHDWQVTGSSDATCIAVGTVDFACAACGATKTETGVYGEHNFGEWIEEEPAKCGVPGVKGHYTCSVCGKDFDADKNEIEDLAIPALTHDWGDWEKVDDDTHRRVCKHDASHVETEAHAWLMTGSSDATCTEKGTVDYKCEVCGSVKTETGDYGEHNYGAWIEEDSAKCEEDGTKGHFHCSVCGKDFDADKNEIENLVIPASGHDFGEWTQTSDPTCTDKGEETRECSRCHETETREVAALGHDFGEWAQTSDPTCTDKGEETRECSLCHETETREVEALGHNFGEWTQTAEPTCTDKGEEIRKCARCDATETREVEALGHDWGAWETVTAAEIGKDGLERRVCARCGEEETRVTHVDVVKDRTVQFVVYEGMHYLVHLDGYDYTIYSKNTKAIQWYSTAPLTFEVVTDREWKYDGFVVLVNQEELAPNADGSYTLPAGTNFKMISVAPVLNLPAIDDTDPTPSGSGTCPFCGKVHPAHLWGRIVALFHQIFYFFARLFGKR